MANDNKWCFAWHVAPPAGSKTERAALVKASKWTPGDVITVSFLDGDPGVQDKVKQVAQRLDRAGDGQPVAQLPRRQRH